jgi:hypothetical protein
MPLAPVHAAFSGVDPGPTTSDRTQNATIGPSVELQQARYCSKQCQLFAKHAGLQGKTACVMQDMGPKPAEAHHSPPVLALISEFSEFISNLKIKNSGVDVGCFHRSVPTTLPQVCEQQQS